MVGCVDRKFRIETDPPGADVYLDGVLIGKSPVVIPFDFHVTHEVRIEKKDYWTEKFNKKLTAPLYEWFPLDFVSENILPLTLNDHHLVRVKLIKRKPLTQQQKEKLIDELQERADTLRKHMEQD